MLTRVANTRKAAQNSTSSEAFSEADRFPLPLSGGLERCTTVWSIAGFDPSSGAGVTADLMTFAAHELFGCSVITALTVQSTRGVFAWQPVSPDLLTATMERLAEDLPPAGIKIGMLGQPDTARAVIRFLQHHKAQSPLCSVVLDPVLRSSSGKALFPAGALDLLHAELLPSVDWITPNWAELGVLTGMEISSTTAVEDAASRLLARHPHLHVVVTGGDQQVPTDLLLSPDRQMTRFPGEHVETTSTHGTGCAFSSALLAELVVGATPSAAVQRAKAYVAGALRAAPGVGHGRGPMGLLWPLKPRRR